MKTIARTIITTFLPMLFLAFPLHGKAPVASPRATVDISSSAPQRKPASFDAQGLERAREMISYSKNNNTKISRKLKAVPESSIIEYFQEHPESLKSDLDRVVRELTDRASNVDTTKHVRLIPPAGRPGYEDLKVFVSHEYHVGEVKKPASNLVQVLRDFIHQAKKEIVLNVYELNIDEVADDLIQAKKNGRTVRVGIDGKKLKQKPQNRPLVDRLRAGGVEVTEVDPVKLNHQKIVAIDWSRPEDARVLFSAGNFTRSCLEPQGDLYALPKATLAKSSFVKSRAIPNANHMITMKSWLAANLVNHELTKTFSKELNLRGSSYPMSGAYQITGPGVDPQTLEAYPEKSFIIAFTPGGGYRGEGAGGVNGNILAYLLKKSKGPIRMTQFTYSSPWVSEALLERAQRDLQPTLSGRTGVPPKPGKFDFLSVGDTPGAIADWSEFLKMSGYRREGSKKKKNLRFLLDSDSAWSKALTEDQMTELRKHVRVAPSVYGKATVKLGDQSYQVEAKIHHKIMSMGDFAVVGTSFNFSKSAEDNTEQLLVFRDAGMVAVVNGITEELAAASPRSVADQAEMMNSKNGVSSDGLDDETADDAAAD